MGGHLFSFISCSLIADKTVLLRISAARAKALAATISVLWLEAFGLLQQPEVPATFIHISLRVLVLELRRLGSNTVLICSAGVPVLKLLL